MKSQKKESLPSIKRLFIDSWDLFKKTTLLYWKVLVVGVIAVLVFTFLAVLLSLPLVRNIMDALRYPTVFEISMIMLFAILALVPTAGAIAAALVLNIASTLIIKEYKTATIKALLTQARPLIAPFFLTSLLAVFFILGGYFFFIIPGVLLSVFFLFIDYEIIFEKQKGLVALKRSYFLVKHHFLGILGRFLLIEVIVAIIQFILTKLLGQEGALAMITLLINIAMGWFVQVYLYVLYKQAKATTTTNASSSLVWLWVLAILGWALLIVLIFFIAPYIPSLLQSLANPFNKVPTGTV